MIDMSQAQQLIGQTLRTADGDKVGKIGQIYIDDHHGVPEWVTVNTGLFGTNESFVPLAEAGFVDNGLVVPYTKAQIKDAPNIDEAGHLSEAQEQDLYRHYDVPYSTEGSTFADTTGTGTGQNAKSAQYTEPVAGGRTTTAAGYDTDAAGYDAATAGYDTGVAADAAMTRSEEELHVGTERVQAGTARLRKWVETEMVTVQVPIRTEKAVLVTEPVTGINVGDAFIGGDEQVVILNTERPVVSKETVAVERVHLETQVEETVQTVNEEVRKEHVELEDDTTATATATTGITDRSGKHKG